MQRGYVRLLRQSGDHLLELINDILDFSRLEADRVELEEVDFAPLTQLQSVVEMFLTQASAKDLYLRQLPTIRRQRWSMAIPAGSSRSCSILSATR